jgi:hypothetical protein
VRSGADRLDEPPRAVIDALLGGLISPAVDK